MNNGHLLVAYHGCDVTVRDALVSGRLKHLDESKNRYDWLGAGVYFFEGDPERALRFAKASRDNPTKLYTARPIATPVVVGAVLSINHCLDMTTQQGMTVYRSTYASLVRSIEFDGATVPTNTAASDDDEDVLLRQLDAAVFNFVHEIRNDKELLPYQAIRAAFRQGEELAPNSGLHEGTHIQLALRDPQCVLGWFLLPGDSLYTQHRLNMAASRLRIATKNRKLRVHSS